MSQIFDKSVRLIGTAVRPRRSQLLKLLKNKNISPILEPHLTHKCANQEMSPPVPPLNQPSPLKPIQESIFFTSRISNELCLPVTAPNPYIRENLVMELPKFFQVSECGLKSVEIFPLTVGRIKT
jgi:hypothetical protein